MNWPPWKKPERRETKAVLGTTDALGKFLLFGDASNATTPSSALNLYEQSTAVSVPINMVADAFSVIEPVLIIDQKMITNHEVLDFLRKPSPHYSAELFFEVVGKNFLITGETTVVALGNVNRPPLELQPLSPKSISVTEGVGGLVDSFIVAGNTLAGVYRPDRDRKTGAVRYFDGNLREFKLVRNFSTRSNSLLRGQSLLVSASNQARQDVLGGRHNVSLLEKGGRVSLIFHFNEDMDDDDFEVVKDRVRKEYGGADEAGSIGVTSGGKLDIKEIGISNKDMDWANLQQMAQKAVALQYRVPLPLITDQRQTLNNYKEGKLALYDDAVIPLSCRVLGGIGSFLLPRFGIDPSKARLAMNPDAVTALVQRRNDELKKRKDINIEADNELRALIGREPYEGGDVILKPATLIPVGTDPFREDNEPGIIESGVTGSARRGGTGK